MDGRRRVDGLTVAIYGDFRPWALASSYRRAFEALGHEVVPIEESELRDCLPLWAGRGSPRQLLMKSRWLRKSALQELNDEISEKVRRTDPDFLFVVNGVELLPETLRRLREGGVPSFLFHADDPLPGSANDQPGHLAVARECDTYFIWSRELRGRLKRAGVQGVQYLPFAWDPDLNPPGEPASDPDHEVVFIGGWDEWREGWLEPVAERFPLRIWGPKYWGTRTAPGSAVREAWQGGAVRGKEYASTVRRSAIVLNILRRQNLPDGTNMRTFEVPGSGGFQLAHRTRGATEIYPEDDAGAYFGSPEELIDRIAHYRRAVDQRHAIADASAAITRKGHRYVDRADSILKTFRGAFASDRGPRARESKTP